MAGSPIELLVAIWGWMNSSDARHRFAQREEARRTGRAARSARDRGPQTLADFPDLTLEVDEDGDTFEHNARKKATEYAGALGQWVFADDSGVCVDALGGAPGVYSAHYAGDHGDDDGEQRSGAREASRARRPRSGRPTTSRCWCWPTPRARSAPRPAASATAASSTEPLGENGFGYDPLFEVREYHRTFGQLGPAVKRAISHRSRAMRAMLPHVVRLLK